MTDAARPTWAYVGRDEAGVIRAASVDTGDARAQKDVRDFMREGLTIDRVPTAFVRANFGSAAIYVPPVDPAVPHA